VWILGLRRVSSCGSYTPKTKHYTYICVRKAKPDSSVCVCDRGAIVLTNGDA
jgi:hypothetical protein